MNKWRFIPNNYGTRSSAEPTDIETFKKTPLLSLAREICQNSIDAKKENENKVVVEFKSFDINRDEIPGYEELNDEINKTCEYNYYSNQKEYESMKEIKKAINNDIIPCIRISDFNTKGLSKVLDEDGSFSALTKGNGISDKYELSGGSKGVGKFASFVVSGFNTVFYSTLNKDGERGYIGVSRMSSRKFDNSKQYTTGVGFYCSDEEISPIMEECKIDKLFDRNTTGTDVIILGFEKTDDWKIQILKKVLDSFLVAIIRDELEVSIDDIHVDTLNVGKIIEETNLGSDSTAKSIISQYHLLTDNNIYKKEFPIEDYGSIEVFVKQYDRDEDEMATRKCTMVRYPLMKIKDISNISNFPCSALCIIPKNQLSKNLIKIENAQHMDWEVSRIINDKNLKNEYKNILYLIEHTIKEFAKEVLMNSESQESDLEGAGDLLPSIDDEKLDTDTKKQDSIQEDEPKITSIRKFTNKNKKGLNTSEDEDSYKPDIGSATEDGDDIDTPSGYNNSNAGNVHEGDNPQGYNEEGDSEVMRKVGLEGIKYRLAMIDKDNGKYIISFDSSYDEDNCELNIYIVDDADNPYMANIEECIVNGEHVNVEDGKGKGIKIKPGKTKIEVKTELKEIYSWEVKINAYR